MGSQGVVRSAVKWRPVSSKSSNWCGIDTSPTSSVYLAIRTSFLSEISQIKKKKKTPNCWTFHVVQDKVNTAVG